MLSLGTCDVFETLTLPEPTEGNDEYKVTVKALADYFEPPKCVDHYVFVFRQEKQRSGESITEFYTCLQLLARKCEFANIDLEIKRQIIQVTNSLRLRRKAIEQNLDLENLLKSARAMETAEEQTSEIEKQQTHAVGYGQSKASDDRPKESSNRKPKRDSRNTICGLCGGSYPHQSNCPAQGKQCLNYGKMNRFSKVCRSKANNRLKSTRQRKVSKGKHRARVVNIGSEPLTPADVDSDGSEEYTFIVGAQGSQTSKPIFQVRILDTPVHVMADSGATVNILSKRDFGKLRPKPCLTDTNVKVYPDMSTKPLDRRGKFRANVVSDHCESQETFYVAQGSSGSILSWMTSQKLNLIKAVNTVGQPPADLPPNVPNFLKDFPNLTNGMGK